MNMQRGWRNVIPFFNTNNMGNPYDLIRLGMGFNQPCRRCGKEIDRRSSPYEPIGMIDYCKCNRKRRR